MLSKRAKNTIKKMGKNWRTGMKLGGWSWAGGFSLVSPEDIKESFNQAKKDGFIKNVGTRTLNEILAFHKLLNELWE